MKLVIRCILPVTLIALYAWHPAFGVTALLGGFGYVIVTQRTRRAVTQSE